ncbi:MAG: phosphoenolpyruvate--protein phosphotransferase [Spirochaetes bacterium]|nr:phosphoenolpyruvate--protein phosphotransferase [Spirochaetota bacterium]
MAREILNGIVASPGIRIGTAYLYKGARIVIPKYTISESEVEQQISRLNVAVSKTKQEIKEIQQQVASSLSDEMADIFTSHLMVLEDPQIVKKAIEITQKEKRNIEWVLNDISLQLIQSLDSIEDDYMRERILDISDIHKRLIGNLQKVEFESLADLKDEVIVFAAELTPSDTASMNKDNVLAFVTNSGGRTSHTAILARALEIPAIVGTVHGTSRIKEGDKVIVDGVHGKVLINPTDEEIQDYIDHQQKLLILEKELSKLTYQPSVTKDGTRIILNGNIELPEEMRIMKEKGASGIGLFRSEFLFIGSNLPDEEKQYREYVRVIEYFKPAPVTIRTIDVGGDKIFSFNKEYVERNPFLGCRAVRFSLANIPIFKTQLRAILRASSFGNVKLMIPMISTVNEIYSVKEILEEVKYELRTEGHSFDENIKFGIMMEVPAAIITADILAKHVDFFSVGTNDLIQYTLAVDRIGEKIAYLYNPLDLSVLRMLKRVVEIAKVTNTSISICGEIAGEPKYTMLLLGLGFRELSMSASFMNHIRQIIRNVTIAECEQIAADLFTIEKTHESERYLKDYLKNKFDFVIM